MHNLTVYIFGNYLIYLIYFIMLEVYMLRSVFGY